MRNLITFVSVLLVGVCYAGQTHNFGNVDEKTVKKDTVIYTISGVTSTSTWLYFKVIEEKPYSGVSLKIDSLKSGTGTDLKIKIPLEFSPKQNMIYNALLTIESRQSVLETVELTGQGTFSNTYYSGTQNKSAEQLKASLKSITSQGYVSLGYTKARDNMYGSIDNVGGQVECVYTGKKATFSTRAGANSASFNCEHTFPQGFFSSNDPMKSDIHHLFPTTTTSNSRRGNDPFGVVSSASWQDGGSKSGGGKFEPRDYHKGTAARAMLYFGVRHKDYSGHLASQEGTLRSWAKQYAPSAKDIKRNNDIFALQKNRNPFVDYPQFLDRISSITGTALDAKVSSLTWSRSLRHQVGDTAENLNSNTWKHVLYNSGSEDVVIDTIYMKDGTSNTYILSGNGKVTLRPNESHEFEVKYGPIIWVGVKYVKDSVIIKTNVTGLKRIAFDHSIYIDAGVGINELDNLPVLSIYPNPALNDLYIDLDGISEAKQLQIVDMHGKVVLKKSKNLDQINISNLSSGEYLIRLELEEGVIRTARFLKQ